jgi:hypothetical protein
MIVAEREMLRLAQSELTVSRLEIESDKLMLTKARRQQYGQSSERARHLIEQRACHRGPRGNASGGTSQAILRKHASSAGRIGFRDFTFEACSGFTRVTARRVAQPPKAAFVTRLRSGQSPSQTARQLPDPSTSA